MENPAKKTKGFFGEFKEFAARGNVVDLAVGVVLGGAFGKITSSLVDDLFMPFIGFLFGGANFSQWNLLLRPEVVDAAGTVLTPAISLNFGSFIGVIVNFLLVAFAMFLLVKGINRMRSKQEEAPAEPPAPPAPTNEELLLTEIRDLLKEK